jgi:hypothetical protein
MGTVAYGVQKFFEWELNTAQNPTPPAPQR